MGITQTCGSCVPQCLRLFLPSFCAGDFPLVFPRGFRHHRVWGMLLARSFALAWWAASSVEMRVCPSAAHSVFKERRPASFIFSALAPLAFLLLCRKIPAYRWPREPFASGASLTDAFPTLCACAFAVSCSVSLWGRCGARCVDAPHSMLLCYACFSAARRCSRNAREPFASSFRIPRRPVPLPFCALCQKRPAGRLPFYIFPSRCA